jgi:glycerol-3-phosphate acyltransferase PlsY
LTYALAAIIGYLLGSIPVALWVGRRHGVDLREVGDRNPGAWNAMEQLGTRAALPVFAGDALKGLAAGLIGRAVGDEAIAGAYAGVAGAMIGHALPVFAGFRGGKSIMTFAGGAFALSPVAAAVALGVCIAVSLAARSFAWGARAGVFGFPLIQLAFDPPGRVIATGALMSFIGLRFLTDFLLSRSSRGRASAASGGRTTR